MLNFTSSRLKLAKRNEKKRATDHNRNPMKTIVDIPMSTEMLNILDTTMNRLDDNTYLTDYVSSSLIQPLDSISIFCPTAALIESKYSAIRIPSPTNNNNSLLEACSNNRNDKSGTPQTSSWNPFHRNILTNNDPNDNSIDNRFENYNEYSVYDDVRGSNLIFNNKGKVSITDDSPHHPMKLNTTSNLNIEPTSKEDNDSNFVNNFTLNKTTKTDSQIRLDVLWLRKRAEIAHEDGEINNALEYLQQAIDAQLGTRDYSKAKLSEHIISNDPKELLANVQSNVVLYDQSVHSLAGIIQRWYHKWYVYKNNMSRVISKVFRGFKIRKNIRKVKRLRKQCIVLIQRRFRIHLKRMHKLATRIKRWYRSRKWVKEYQKKLYIYRMARRIQRLFRGYLGRKLAKYEKLKLNSIKKIQYNVRGYFIRRDHHYIISLYHKYYYYSALRIQQFVRKKQAIYRTQIKLIIELRNEMLRLNHEKAIVDETLRVQKIKNYYYFNSKPGEIHLHYIQRKNNLQYDFIINHNKSSSSSSASSAIASSQQQHQHHMSNEDKAIKDILYILEPYDSDGTGKFNVKYLKTIMSKLLIPLNKNEQYFHVKNKLDNDNSGFVNFLDLIEWYSSEDADNFLEPDNLRDNLSIMILEIRKLLVKLNVKRYRNRLYKLYNSEHSEWLIRDTTSSFRLVHPPKYECCQCRSTFVLFTDYYHHFTHDKKNSTLDNRTSGGSGSSTNVLDNKGLNNSSVNNNNINNSSSNIYGLCPLNQQRGLFYFNYWIRSDWLKQRQCEYEVKRINDENSFLQYHAKIQCYEYLAIENEAKLYQYYRILFKQSFALHQESLLSGNPIEIISNTKQIIINLLTACNSKTLSIPLIDCLLKSLYLPSNKNWILNDYCTDTEFIEWMNKYLVHPQQLQQQLVQQQHEQQLLQQQQHQQQEQNLSINKKKSSVDGGNTSKSNNKSKRPSSGDKSKSKSSISSLSSGQGNTSSSTNTTNSTNHMDKSIAIQNSLFVSTFRLPTFTTYGLIKQKAYDLSRAHVKFLRLFQIETQSNLFKLLEFRHKRPRKITIDDSELKSIDMISLTSYHYQSMQETYIHQLSKINDEFLRVYSKEPIRRCGSRICGGIFNTHSIVNPSDHFNSISLYKENLIIGRYIAYDTLSIRNQSKMGQIVMSLLAYDMYLTRCNVHSNAYHGKVTINSSNKASSTSETILNDDNISINDVKGVPQQHQQQQQQMVSSRDLSILLYQLNKYSSILMKDNQNGIDYYNFDLFADELSLKIPEADKMMILQHIDPLSTGNITLPNLLRWINDNNHKSFQNSFIYYHKNYHMIVNKLILMIMLKSYNGEANDVLHSRYRDIINHEIRLRDCIVHHGYINNQKWNNVLSEFYQLSYDETGVNKKIDGRKYNTMLNQSVLSLLPSEVSPSAALPSFQQQQSQQIIPLIINHKLTSEESNAVAAAVSSIESSHSSHQLNSSTSTSTNTMNRNTRVSHDDPNRNRNIILSTSSSPSPSLSKQSKSPQASSVSNHDVGFASTSKSFLADDNHDKKHRNNNNSINRKSRVSFDNNAMMKGKPLRRSHSSILYDDDENSNVDNSKNSNDVIKDNPYELLSNLYLLKYYHEESEFEAIYDIAKKKSKSQFYLDLISLRVWKKWQYEQLYFKQMDEWTEAYQYCINKNDYKTAHPIHLIDAVDNNHEKSHDGRTNNKKNHNIISNQYDVSRGQRRRSSDAHIHNIQHNNSNNDITVEYASNHWFSSSHLTNELIVKNKEDDEEGYLHVDSTTNQLLNHNDKVDTVHSYTIDSIQSSLDENSHSNAMKTYRHWALECFISAFDTNCKGTLDEVEIKALLRCLHLHISENIFRNHFANSQNRIENIEISNVITFIEMMLDSKTNFVFVQENASSRNQKNNAEDNSWMSIFPPSIMLINRASNHSSSLRLLLCLQQQLSYHNMKRSIYVSKTNSNHHLLNSNNRDKISATDNNDVNGNRNLFMKSQIFVMRQVKLFLTTTYGKIQLYRTYLELNNSWNIDINGINNSLGTDEENSHNNTSAEVGNDDNNEVLNDSFDGYHYNINQEKFDSKAGNRKYMISNKTDSIEKNPSNNSPNYYSNNQNHIHDNIGIRYLTYAYSVHYISTQGILVFEIPHIIKFIIKHLKLKPTQYIGNLYQLFNTNSKRGSNDMRWINYQEYISLISPLFNMPQQNNSTDSYANNSSSINSNNDSSSTLNKKHSQVSNTNNDKVQTDYDRIEFKDSNQKKKGDYVINRTKYELRMDSKCRMYSIARQQALLISMNIPNINVPETNYRCYILGLKRFIKVHLQYKLIQQSSNPNSKIPSVVVDAQADAPGATAATSNDANGANTTAYAANTAASINYASNIKSNSMTDAANNSKQPHDDTNGGDTGKRSRENDLAINNNNTMNRNRKKGIPIDWDNIPREAASIYLLSKGYRIKDLFHPILSSFLEIDHFNGDLSFEMVNVQKLDITVRQGIAKSNKLLEYLYRLPSRLSRRMYNGFKLSNEYYYTIYALFYYLDDVENYSAEYLKEIVFGVSFNSHF